MAVREAGILLLAYTAASIILAFIFKLLLRNWNKASLLAFAIMCVQFFFGSSHDFLKRVMGDSFLVSYSFILSFFLFCFVLFIILLRRSSSGFLKTTRFFNLLLIVLLLMEILPLARSIQNMPGPQYSIAEQLEPCKNCPKPDIYLILADEYAGKTALNDLFSFDNSHFENQLKARGFHVNTNTRSNYNATLYSMASMLNLNYVSNLESNMVNQRDMFICKDLINRNNTLAFLNKLGYTTYNYSFFDFNGIERKVVNPFFITKYQMFTAQTFTNRVKRDILFNFSSPQKIAAIRRKHFYNNHELDSLLRNNVSTETRSPKLVYTHLAMPHHPYYTDSTGREIPLAKLPPVEDKSAYIQYLVHTNKKLLSLVDHILQGSKSPPIIILMSDHGFRQYSGSTSRDYYFSNLNAVYFPNKDYSRFYNGITNINQFRILLNSQFRQDLPLLKDSLILMGE